MTRRLRHVLTALWVILAAAPTNLLACAVCFGDPNDPATQGMNYAVLFLLGVVALVQVGFIKLFWTIWRRSRSLQQRRERFQVLDGGVHK